MVARGQSTKKGEIWEVYQDPIQKEKRVRQNVVIAKNQGTSKRIVGKGRNPRMTPQRKQIWSRNVQVLLWILIYL